MKWPSRCHVLCCQDLATHETLIGSRLCDAHFSDFYSADTPCPLEGRLGERLPVTLGAYRRHAGRCVAGVFSTAWWRRVPSRVRFRARMAWHRIWFPISWHVPSWWGHALGRHACNYCDRYVVRVLDKRDIWICDGCREWTFAHAEAGFGGDFGRNQQCVQCGMAADCEVRQQPYCIAHGHQAWTGEPYVPPSEEKIAHHRAMWEAMRELQDEGDGPPTISTPSMTHAHLDGSYLQRLFSRIHEKLER